MSTQLVIRAPNHLGDCVMALPMISDAREAIPGSNVTLLVPESLHELFLHVSGIDRIVPIPARYTHGLTGVMYVRDLLRAQTYDIGFILPPSFGAASSFALAGVKTRIGYISDGRRLLLTKPLPLPAPLISEHRSKLYYDLLRRGLGVAFEHRPPRLHVTEAMTDVGQQLLRQFRVEPATPVCVIGFRAVAESRRWGTTHYAELSRWLIEHHGMSVVLIGTADGATDAEQILAQVDSPRICSLAGKTSLTELQAVISCARLFIGDESGAAHLAAALGLPVVVAAGAAAPSETGPLARQRAIVRLEELDCLGCVKNSCPLPGAEFMRCMKRLTPDHMQAAVALILAEHA